MNDPLIVGMLGMAGMFLLIALHVPIGVAMGIAGFLAFAANSGVGPAFSLFGTEAASAMGNLDLVAIPLFLLMGGFASAAGLSSDIYRLAHAMIGHKRGGLAASTIFGCAGFGAVCGSSVATASAMTTVALPEMHSRGYLPSLATGCIAAGGTLGILIPPSIIMVIYALLTEQFVITLYVAAIIPSLIAVTLQLLAVAWVVRADPLAGPAGPRVAWTQRLAAIRGSWAALALTLIIFGGIYGGIFTVNEAAAVGAALSFLVAWARLRLTRAILIRTLTETASTTGMIYMVLIGANVLTYFVTASGMPAAMVEGIQHLGLPPLLVITVLLILYIILGAIFEEVSVMLITLPFVLPMITGFGYSPVWWGIINVIVIEIGMICPPIGLNVFVVHGLARDVPLKTIYSGIMPFLYSDIARLALLVLLPGITLWLPNVMGLK
ncbi:MAG: C4-dicarboxylate ABC transporter permease [Betaproteobacteria bacterium RIFCSPLOWO2_02_FULL_62_17]|nr:MAG: C4-dicarboxylate ABC transporter permease [Betaproteobacteria bacterium RIFCSPLOWO2_02_FULL_62_17]